MRKEFSGGAGLGLSERVTVLPSRRGRVVTQRQKTALVLTVVVVLVVMTVVMSLDWTMFRFRAGAEITILAGMVVAALLLLSLFVASRFALSSMFCPSCPRRIPGDANLCPYCGTRLR